MAVSCFHDGRKKDYNDDGGGGGQVASKTFLTQSRMSDYGVDFGLFGGVCAQFSDGGDSVDDGVLP